MAARLRDRSNEPAEEIFNRIWHLEDGPNLQPPRTFDGLRPLIHSLVEYGAVAVELGERQCPPPPPAVLEHARNAAWAAVSVQRLHGGYLAARTVFDRFLRREARSVDGYEDDVLSEIHGSNDIVFERLFQVVGREFEEELAKKRRSTSTQRLERVKALLAGELVRASDLGYEFDATHIGIVGSAEGLAPHIEHVATSLGGRLLLVEPSPQKVWAWISIRPGVSSSQVASLLSEKCCPATLLSLGDPSPGLLGWRRTHQQAETAFRIAARMPGSAVSYGEHDLLAFTASGALIRTDLQRTYLDPLARDRDGGRTLRNTLRVYFDSGQNASCAAELLGVSRQTVSKHVQKAENYLGFSVRSRRAPSLHIALQLEELGFFDPVHDTHA